MAEDLQQQAAPQPPVAENGHPVDEGCLDCGVALASEPVFRRYRVCPACRHHYTLSAIQRVHLLTDAGTFKETNPTLAVVDPLSFTDKVSYRDRLEQAQRITGLLEAVVTGTGFIGGIQFVIASVDYGFMGGSVGIAVGEKITQAAELALQRHLPFVMVTCGGAPRMQEGVLALMQMAKMVAGIKRLHREGVPVVSVMASPTTGHLLAGAATMADLVFAEPGATIGFAPLRVAEQAMGRPLPENAHTAEFALRHGMIDGIVDRQRLKRHLELVLDLLGFKYRLTIAKRARLRQAESAEAPAWRRVQLARRQDRPTSRDYIDRIISNLVELHGDRLYGDDPAILCGLGYLAGEAVVIIAQERGHGESSAKYREGRALPEGYRKAQRAMSLAAKFKLPVVTFIDTPGVYAGLEAEERGIAQAISATISLMSDLPVPIVSVIIGEGGSGGALALSVADRILMMENAIYTPIAPEAAAWILYRSADRVEDVASALKLTAADCRALGIIDTLVPEPEGGAHNDLPEAARQMERLLVQALLDAQMTFTRTLLRRRFQKFRRMGTYATTFQSAITEEAGRFQNRLGEPFRNLVDRLISGPPGARDPIRREVPRPPRSGA